MSVDALLSALVVMLVPFSWVSAVVLIRAARPQPRINVLTERAALAVAIAVMVTAGGIITVNRNADHAFFAVDAARILFSLSLIVIGSFPVAWTLLWVMGRLSEPKGE